MTSSLKNYENLKIIGTSHIAKQSVNEINNAVEEWKPDIIALELDAQRLYALTHPKKQRGLPNFFRIGIRGALLALLGQWVQKKLGAKVGVEPGAEMREAIKLAKKHKLQIALIDQNIEITLRNFSKALTWRERFRIAKDVLQGMLYGEKELESLGIKDLDLSKVPEDKVVEKLIKEVKQRYPGIYKVLVEDRNKVMVKRLMHIIQREPEKKVLAIMGAGHKRDVEKLLRKKLASADNDVSLSYSYNISAKLSF